MHIIIKLNTFLHSGVVMTSHSSLPLTALLGCLSSLALCLCKCLLVYQHTILTPGFNYALKEGLELPLSPPHPPTFQTPFLLTIPPQSHHRATSQLRRFPNSDCPSACRQHKYCIFLQKIKSLS